MSNGRLKLDAVGPVSLLETLKAIDAGTLSPSRSVTHCLDRITALDGAIKAFACLAPDATDHAATAHGPMRGIALAVKDIFDTADLPTEHNSPLYRGHRPARDASLVSMARQLGCSLIGKSATTEFAYFEPCDTRNPHNLDHTPGGSSSGSAAAVAAGMAHLALGTQTGGSVIRPAAYCGVTGYKPSKGLLPKVGIKDFAWTLDTPGLFTKSVADAAFAAACLTGRTLRIEREKAFELPRIGVVRSHMWPEADPEMRSQFEALISALAQRGVDLIDLEPSDTHIAAFHAHQIIQDYEARQALDWEYRNHADRLSPLLRQTLDFAQTISHVDYDEAHICTKAAIAEMQDLFEDVGCLISPSAPGPAPSGLASTGSSIFNRIWTLLGLPAINVAGLKSQTGLPMGIQVIGPAMADQDTLRAAHWIESLIERMD